MDVREVTAMRECMGIAWTRLTTLRCVSLKHDVKSRLCLDSRVVKDLTHGVAATPRTRSQRLCQQTLKNIKFLWVEQTR